jgi:membrane protein required for beta-lactamase induction
MADETKAWMGSTKAIVGLLLGIFALVGYIASVVREYTVTTTTLQVKQSQMIERIAEQQQAIKELQANFDKTIMIMAAMHDERR